MNAITSERNLKIDFFRGLALLIIFIDHIYNNRLGGYTLHSYGIADAAEIFFFCSGYVSLIVYRKVLYRNGFVPAQRKAVRRSLDIYGAHVALALAVFATCYLLRDFEFGKRVIDFRHWQMVYAPDPSHFYGLLTLSLQPFLFGILPVYIVLCAITPLYTITMKRAPGALMAASLILYLLVQFPQLDIGAMVFSNWYFNPLAYQLLFALGMLCAAKPQHISKILAPNLKLFTLSMFVLAITFVFNNLVPFLYKHYSLVIHPSLPLNHLPLTSKYYLGPLRIIHFFVLSYAVLLALDYLKSHRSRLYRTGKILARPVVNCGQHSLAIFVAGAYLSYLFGFVISHMGNGAEIWIPVNTLGIAILLVFARVLSSRKNDSRPN